MVTTVFMHRFCIVELKYQYINLLHLLFVWLYTQFHKQEDHLLVDNLVSKLDSDWKDIHSILLRATVSML